jgi:hypothetical protein
MFHSSPVLREDAPQDTNVTTKKMNLFQAINNAMGI